MPSGAKPDSFCGTYGTARKPCPFKAVPAQVFQQPTRQRPRRKTRATAMGKPSSLRLKNRFSGWEMKQNSKDPLKLLGGAALLVVFLYAQDRSSPFYDYRSESPGTIHKIAV